MKLDQLKGQHLESRQQAEKVMCIANETASSLRKAIECPKEGCGLPSKIRITTSGSDPALTFEHARKDGIGRTAHGAHKIVPSLILVPTAPDRRKKSPTDEIF